MVELVALLGRATVRRAITNLTPTQRERIAMLVGLDDRPMQIVEIARAVGIIDSSVSESIQRGVQAIENTAALAEFDEAEFASAQVGFGLGGYGGGSLAAAADAVERMAYVRSGCGAGDPPQKG
jgi:hypothetical protein